MPETRKLHCWKCAARLDQVELPLSRFDRCPECLSDLRVCRACVHFDPQVLGQCRHERAERLVDKQLANFCTYFYARLGRFQPLERSAAERSREALDALFGGDAAATDAEPAPSSASGETLADLFGDGQAGEASADEASADEPATAADQAKAELERLFGKPGD